jgi:DNA-binding beta-propeller fold protein YncE
MSFQNTKTSIRKVHVALMCLGVVIFLANLWTVVIKAQDSQKREIPKFVADPQWRKPLPDQWITGEVGGTCFDAQDHLFTVNRGNLTPKELILGIVSPAVIEFDTNGQVVNSWGDRKILPNKLHGCFVDYQGNVWIAGNEDAIVQKYTHDGSKLLLQIGTKGRFDSSDGTIAGAPLNSSHELLNLPSSVAVDPTNGDVYISDGYGNRRVVVFDREGHYLRQWGRQGTLSEVDAGEGGVFLKVVHYVVLGNDGLVYVCDRLGGRIEVFDKMGNFKRNIKIESKTARLTGIGAVCQVGFSPDPEQKFMYVCDCGDEQIRVLDHASGLQIVTFGRSGYEVGEFNGLHSLAVDSKGNIVTGEAGVATGGGHRVQMFRWAGN